MISFYSFNSKKNNGFDPLGVWLIGCHENVIEIEKYLGLEFYVVWLPRKGDEGKKTGKFYGSVRKLPRGN